MASFCAKVLKAPPAASLPGKDIMPILPIVQTQEMMAEVNNTNASLQKEAMQISAANFQVQVNTAMTEAAVRRNCSVLM